LLGIAYGALAAGSSIFIPESSSLSLEVAKLVPLGILLLTLAVQGRGHGHIGWELGLLCTLAFLSAAWSVDPGLTAARAAALSGLALVAFWGLPRYWTSPNRLAITVEVMVLAGLAIALAGLIAIPFVDQAFLRGRFTGILQNPNALGGLLAPLFPLAWLLPRWHPQSRGLVWAAMPVMAVALSPAAGPACSRRCQACWWRRFSPGTAGG
jgi:hypothetical protein